MQRLAKFIGKYSRVILVAVVLLNLLSLASLYRFNLDTEFLSFFTKGNAAADAYQTLNQKYQVDETITVLVESDASLLEPENLLRAHDLGRQIASVPGVGGAQGFIPPEIPGAGGVVPVDQALILAQPEPLADFIEQRYFFSDQFLSENRRIAIFVATVDATAEVSEVIDALRDIVAGEEQFSLSLAGNEIIEDTLWDYLIRILLTLIPGAILLILLVLFLMLRNVKLTLLAMLPAAFGVLWTIGTIFWSGLELNIMTILSPIFILVMGSAYGLHYVSHYAELKSRYADLKELTAATLGMVGTPIFLATVTTMAGFGSLIWSDMVPLRQMGIFVTLGIGYAGCLALFLLPTMLSHADIKVKPRPAGQFRLLKPVLAVSRRPWVVGVVFVIVVAAAASFLPRLEVRSDPLMFFKSNSEIRQTFATVEEHFGSALPLVGEISLPQGPAALADVGRAREVLALEREIEELSGIISVFSIFDVIQGVYQMTTGATDYPDNPALIQGLTARVGDTRGWVSGDGVKLMVRSETLSRAQINALNDFVSANPQLNEITGMPLLFEEMNHLVVQSQIRSLGLALGLIFVLLWITLRRLRAALVGLAPIVVTILVILGMLAASGFHLSLLTANISAIAIGVGVDYAIHLISGIRYFRRQGLPPNQAVEQAVGSVGRPVLTNAFALAIGLSVLFLSPLYIHTQVAAVMWVAMMVSSIGALLLIPNLYRGD
jgi:uncharacterized protein